MKRGFLDFRLRDLPRDFVRLAGDILREDPAQLGAQLAARLDAQQLAALSPQLQALAASGPVELLHPSVDRVGGSLLATWSTKQYPFHGVLDGNDTLYVRLDERTLASWNLDQDWEPHLVGSPEAEGIGMMVYNPGARALAFAFGGEVLLGERILKIHEESMRDMAIGEDGQAVSIDWNYHARIWDTATGQVLQEFARPEDPNRHYPDREWQGACAIHRTATRVLFHDGVNAYGWSIATGALCWSVGVDSLNEGAFAVSPNGRVVLVDSTFYDSESGHAITEMARRHSTRQAVFSPDGSRLYTMHRYDPRLYIREPIMGETLDTFIAASRCRQLLLDSQGRLVTISADIEASSFNTIQWWDPAGRKAVRPTHVFPRQRGGRDYHGAVLLKYGQWPPSPPHSGPAVKTSDPKCGEFLSRKGRYGLRVYPDAAVHEIQAKPPAEPKFDFGATTIIAPGGQFVLYIQDDTGRMSLWDLADQIEIPMSLPDIPLHRDDVDHNRYALSPDGAYLAIVRCFRQLETRSSIEVWGLRDALCWQPMSVMAAIGDLRIASGGRFGVYFSYGKGMARFECAAEGVCCDGFESLAAPPVRTIAMTSDGRFAVAGGANRITICDVERQCRIATFSGDHQVDSCSISEDGSLVAVEEHSGRVHYLRLPRELRRPQS